MPMPTPAPAPMIPHPSVPVSAPVPTAGPAPVPEPLPAPIPPPAVAPAPANTLAPPSRRARSRSPLPQQSNPGPSQVNQANQAANAGVSRLTPRWWPDDPLPQPDSYVTPWSEGKKSLGVSNDLREVHIYIIFAFCSLSGG
jgi:hypothetical protein